MIDLDELERMARTVLELIERVRRLEASLAKADALANHYDCGDGSRPAEPLDAYRAARKGTP